MPTEKIVLNVPIVYVVPNRTDYGLKKFSIELIPSAKITVLLAGMDEAFEYPVKPTEPPTAGATDTVAKTRNLIDALNTANLTTRSLWKRLFDKLVADFPDRFVGGATVA